MRRAQSLAMPLAVATAAAFIISIGQAADAQAATGGILHVDNSATSHCSNSTTDSSVTPYCTIQAAVNAAQPGDTVLAKSGDTFNTETDITTSGTAGAPITIDGGYVPGVAQGAYVFTNATYAFNISGAQYINLKGFTITRATEDDVYVNNSQHVTVSGMVMNTRSTTPTAHSVYFQSSSNSTVETSRFYGNFGWDVGIGGYGTSDTVTTNAFFNAGAVIEDTAVPNVAITSNTVDNLCGLGINITAGEAGLATGTTIENNILSDFTCPTTAILGDSQEVSTADYNIIFPNGAGSTDYYWLPTASGSASNYATPVQFCAAVGQGCHDLATDPGTKIQNQGQITADSSSAVDSADANAPGELPTDLLGRPHVDDLNVANTGTGSQAYYDRGAYEFQDPFAGSGISFSTTATNAYSVQPTIGLRAAPWGAFTVAIDFGDGTPAVIIHNATAPAHQYAKLGTYPISMSLTDAAGGTATFTSAFTTAGSEFIPFGPTRLLDTRKGTGGTSGRVLNGQDVPLQIDGAASLPGGITAVALTVTATGSNAPGYVSAEGGTSLLNYSAGETIANSAILPVVNGEVQLTVTTSAAASAGTYLVADVTGYFTGSMASGYTSVAPARLLDTRNGTGVSAGKITGGKHVVLTIEGADQGALPSSGVKAVSLNLTATGGTGGGYVTAYPDGSATPLASNLNFAQGQTIAAAAIVPVGSDGKIDLYFGGAPTQAVDLVADVAGYYNPSSTAAFVPLVPDRVIDTRRSGGPLANNATVTFDPANVEGLGIVAVLPGNVQEYYYALPRNAAAFDFNLTVTQPTSAGVITAYPYESQSTPIPSVSNLNYVQGETIANFAQTTSGPAELDGAVDISPNRTAGTVQLIADLFGVYTSS
jgi:hypothetical protein